MNKYLFEQVAKNTDDYALLLIDVDGNIVFCNAGSQRIKGYSEKELIGRNFSTLYTPHDQQRKKPQSLLEAARINGKSKDEGWRMRKDGSTFLADMTLTALYDEKGTLTGFFKILKDITEEKKAANQLLESEKRFKDLIYNVPGVIYQYEQLPDGSSSFSYVSPKLKELFGIEPDQMHRVPELIHPDDREGWLQSMDLARQEQRPWLHEGRLLYPDGSIKWWRASYVISEGEGGRLLYNGIMEDISRDKRMARRISEQQQQFKVFVQHAPAAVAMLDRDMNYLAVSDRWISDYHLAGKQVIGASHYDLFVGVREDQERREIYERCLSGGVERRDEERVVLDGEVNWIRWEMHPWYRDDREVGGVMIFSEMITREVLVRQHLEKLNTQLASSNKDLEHFAYVVSHDLQEPLRMVGSFMDLLKEEYSQNLDENALTYIKFAVDGAERMKRLIKDLLAFSKVPSSAQQGSLRTLPARQALDDVLRDMSVQIEESGAQIEIGNLPRLTYDHTQLRQVFQNLISNALKYNKSEWPVVGIGCDEEDIVYRFYVRDNGIGIAPEYRDKVFDIFQRLHSRKQYEGSGIGLAICKKIVEYHGGRIWVENNADGGSTFFFTILKT